MKTCVFFGHRYCTENIKEELEKQIIELIEKHSVTLFYVGNNGNFDSIVCSTLKKLSKQYPKIRFYVVLAYHPNKIIDYIETVEIILPDGLERRYGKYAIVKRNRWMVEQADYVICYVVCSAGGAAQFVELAARKGKKIINIANKKDTFN